MEVLMKNIKLYNVKPEVFEYYRLNTKGNRNTSHDQIIKKLTRNVLLSRKLNNDKDGNEIYQYGRLLITVNPNTYTITEISNYTISNYYWNGKHTRKYDMLNKILGIVPDVVNA
jgi:hypothetical protein